jgi:hypothetical protein
LIVLAPLVAEVLSGSTPLTMPALLVVDVLIYGSGALLIRELVRRRQRGWPSILLLGAAYGLIEEGLALQSFFDPGYGAVAHWGARVAGVNGVYTVVSILVHMVWSVVVPIVLTDLLFPARRAMPYLRRFGLAATIVWYLLGVAVLWLFARISSSYVTPPLLLGLVALLALVLVVIALWALPPQASQTSQASRSRSAPAPWQVVLMSGVGAFIGLALPTLGWRTVAALAYWPFVVAPLASAVAIALGLALAVRSWAHTAAWSGRHQLALASGLLMAHSAVGGLLFTRSMSDAITIAALGLVMVLSLALFAWGIRGRTTRDEKRIASTTSPLGAPRGQLPSPLQ